MQQQELTYIHIYTYKNSTFFSRQKKANIHETLNFARSQVENAAAYALFVQEI